MSKGPTRDDLCYRTSRWQRLLYGMERDANPQLVRAEEQGEKRAPRFADYQRELFARLYNPRTPALKEPADGAEWAQKLHGLAEEVAEFKVLQERCRGDEMWSGMATTSIVSSVQAKMKPQESNQDVEKMKQRVDALEEMAQQGVDVKDRVAKAKAQLARAQQQAAAMKQGLDPSTIRQAVREACAKAQQEIGERESELAAYSYGTQPGQPGQGGGMQAKRDLAKRLGGSSKLKRIAQLAGRLRRVAAEKQRSKTNYAREEINSVEQGADLDRVLPSELAALATDDETQELVFFQKLLERKALQYSLKGREREGRGPIIICMDESGSMSGQPEEWSKAVALALLDIAQRQKRSWVFVHFDSRVSRVDVVKHGAVEQGKLLECMLHFTGGGTSFEEPLQEALRRIDADGGFKKADVLLVTDGCCYTGPAFDDEFAAQKKAREMSVFTVLVNGAGAGGCVTKWSDQVFQLEDLLRDGDKFEDAAFSI